MKAHKETWSIAFPMMLSNLTVPLLGIVDTAVMGHLPDAQYLGGVALGAMIFTFIFWGFGFLRMSTTGITAQALGTGDHEELRAILGRSVLLALILTIPLLLLQWPILWLALFLLEGSMPVEALAAEYFEIRIWAVPAVLLRYVLFGWFLGMQNTRAILYITLLINSLNIVLDLILVIGLKMTVAGVAWATVIAEYIGLLFSMGLLLSVLRAHPGRWVWDRIMAVAALSRMLLINQQIFVRTLLLMFAFAFFTAQSAKFGDVILAANSVLKNFLMLISFGLDSFAHAAETLVGKAVGNRDRARFLRYIKVTGIWSVVGALLYTVVFLLFGSLIVSGLTDIPDVRESANQYLPWLWLAPLVGVWSYWLDGIFIGATQGRAMRDTMLFATLVYLLVWYIAQPLGNHGLWFALLFFLGIRGVAMGVAFVLLDRRQKFIPA